MAVKKSAENASPAGFKEYIGSLIKGDRNQCFEYVKDYLERDPDYIRLYEEVFKKSLYEVGEMWEYNRITVATEHLATSITGLLLNRIYHGISSSDKNGRKIVLACTEKEEHQIGIRMVADLFELYGWDTFFPGTDIPAGELIMFIKDINPDMLALSLSVYFNLSNLENMIRLVRIEFPELPVIIGGQAFRHGGKEIILKSGNISFIEDLYSLELFLKKDLKSRRNCDG